MSHTDGGETSIRRELSRRPRPLSLDNGVLHNAGRESLSQFIKEGVYELTIYYFAFVVEEIINTQEIYVIK